MFIFRTIADLQAHLYKLKETQKEIGFVPTMGALHEGHISLLAALQQNRQISVCSIFVNPTQFNNATDLEKYPRTVEDDIAQLTHACCDILFLPSVEEMYPAGMQRSVDHEFGELETVLDGAHRPGHFQGVAQVVARLLDIVAPDTLYLGQKDYQQCAIISKLVKDKNIAIDIEIVATKREQDGLAMSSRNRRLTEPQRAVAGVIYQCLVSIQTKQGIQDFSIVKKECLDILEKKGFKVDYIELADADTLQLLDNYKPESTTVALIAAYLGDIRLIDNLLL